MQQRRGSVRAIVVLAAGLGVVLPAAPEDQEPAETIVITGSRVLDVTTGRARAVESVVVEGDVITEVHEQAAPPVPAQARRVDATGLTLVPGLFDMWAQAMPSPSVEVDFAYALSLAHGVMGLRTVDAPLPWATAQRTRVADNQLLAPRLWTSGPRLDLHPPGDTTTPRDTLRLVPAVTAATFEALSREVERQIARKVDWIRLGPGVGAQDAARVVAIAHRAGVKVSVEAGVVPMGELATAGVDIIDGLGLVARNTTPPASNGSSQGPTTVAELIAASWERASAGDIQRAAEALARSKVALVPRLRLAADGSLATTSRLMKAELAVLSRRHRETVERQRSAQAGASARSPRVAERQRSFVRAFAGAGGRLLVSSGAGPDGWPVPGAAVHHDMALLVDSGLSPADVIRAATVNAAASLGAGQRAGQIRKGFRADLIGVTGDPVRNIESVALIALIVRGGEVVERDHLLDQARRAASRIR